MTYLMKHTARPVLVLLAFMLATASPAFAATDSGDTAWILTATALVLFMTLPGLALFYGGLVQAKNVLSVFMQCMAVACLMSILWLAAGYSIAFGEANAYWGGLGKAFLSGVTDASENGTLPEGLYFAFQMTFAVITPALIIGAFVERVKFSAVLLFCAAWVLIVYAPVAHWVWGGGWLDIIRLTFSSARPCFGLVGSASMPDLPSLPMQALRAP